MPVMDGLELAEWIDTNRLEIKVVVISAYNDFSYAKMAIKYNVYYYLLKVIDVDELLNAMNNLKLILDEKIMMIGI